MTNPNTTDSSKNLTWQIALLAGPLVLQNFSQTLLGVADTYFVSSVSTEALAAVGLAGVMYFAILLLFRSTATSTVVFVGRAIGEQNPEKVGTAVWRSLNMIAWLSLTVLFMPTLFSWLMWAAAPSDSPMVRELGTQYLQIRAIEMPLVMFSSVVWGFLIGRNDSRTPMILAWITVFINIILDWLLVQGNLGAPALGVAGAAYATVIANGLNAILSAFILWNGNNRKQYATNKPHLASWTEISQVLKIGLPMGFGDFIEIASFSVFFALIARLGTEVLAANQIALQYMSLSFTFGIAIGMATSSLIAQYLGAGQPDLAEKVGYRASLMAMGGMGIIGLSHLIAPATLLGVFSDDPKVIEAGVTILQLVALYQIFDAAGIVFASALNGAGDTRFTMLSRLILAWGLFLPLVWVWLFIFDGTIWNAWAGALIYLTVLSFVNYLRFRSGHWKSIQLA